MTLREKRQNLNGKGEEVSYCCYATHENLDDNTNKLPHFCFQIRTFQILNQFFFFFSNYNHNIFLVIYLLLLYIGRYGQNNKKKKTYTYYAGVKADELSHISCLFLHIQNFRFFTTKVCLVYPRVKYILAYFLAMGKRKITRHAFCINKTKM